MADTVIGSYRITQQLGVGGMGAVYAGEHTLLGRKAAIKVLLPELSHDQGVVARFFNEARAATAIKHPGIVQIYDFGHQDDGSAYIAMELLEGEGLDARLRRLGKLPVQQALRSTGQIASALAAAHARGIFHRDLKPGNLFIVPDLQVAGGERVKILDFGIAKIARADDPGAAQTRAGTIMGSPSYMSPEQCRGAGEIDHRADLYSLGCILFEMLCGRPPFLGGGNGPIAVMSAQLHEQPPAPSSLRPELTPEIDALVLQLLAKHPDGRPASAAHLGHAVSAISGEQVSFAALGQGLGATAGALDELDAPTEQYDAPPGGFDTGAVTAPHTGMGTGRLIDQLAGQSGTSRSTGGLTGPMTGGVTGGASQMGRAAPAQGTARSGLSQARVDAGAGQQAAGTGRRAVWALAALVIIGGASAALSQLGGDEATEPAPVARTEPAVEPAPEPAVKPPPEPKLTFYALAEDSARRGRSSGRDQGGLAGLSFTLLAEAPGGAPAALRLPTFSWSSLFSGSLFSGLMQTLAVLVEPEPVIVTWKLATSPPGADVLRGDQVVGNTARPLVIELEQTPGFTETFTLRLDRYQEKTIELRGDQSFDEVVELAPKVYATVASRPEGAEVVDASGAVLGTAPMEIEIDPAAGPRLVSLRLDRHEEATLELAGAESFEQTVKLVPRIYATVQSRPEGAEVFDQGGQPLGVAPVEIELPRGEDGRGLMTVTLKLDRHEDATVELAGKRSFRETVRLRPRIYATVASRPEGAEVLDAQGASLGIAPVTFELPRDAQPARVTLRLEGHQDTEATLRGGRSFTKNVRLRPRPRVTIMSRPEGAEVFDAAGASLGTAPLEVLVAGTGAPEVFTLKLDGHHDERVEVEARRDRTVRVELAPALGPVTVRIESRPPGAEVWKGKTLLGTAPVDDRFEGTPDRVRYTLKLDGHRQRTVRVAGDRDASEVVELRECERKPRRGSLGLVDVYGGC